MKARPGSQLDQSDITAQPQRVMSSAVRIRAVGYVRVSTRMQADEGLSLAAQKDRIAAFCEAQDYSLIEIFCDVDSGAKDNRPGCAAALAMLEQGKADALLVMKMDRLSRSLKHFCDLYERYFKDQPQRKLISIRDEGINLTSPVGRLFANMMMGFAQMERELISGRVAEAVSWKASKGYFVGKVPFGYRKAPAPDGSKYKVLVEDAAQQQILQDIKALIENGIPPAQIAAELTTRQIKPPQGLVWTKSLIYNLKRRRSWHKSRPINSCRWHTEEELRQRALALRDSGNIPRQIAAILNSEKYVPFKGQAFTEAGIRQLLKAWQGTRSHHPRIYLQAVIERLRQEHLANNSALPFRPPGSPRLAALLTSQGFATPKGKTTWFPAQALRLLEGQFDVYYGSKRAK